MSMQSRRRQLLAFITVALVASAPLANGNPSAISPPQGSNALPKLSAGANSGRLDRAIDAYLSKETAADRFSGVVLVAKDGAPVFRKAYGFADRANKRPNNVRTRFNLGSLNKILTRAAIDQLVMAGRLSRTSTLGSVLPDYPQSISHPATVEQLITMTAGLNDLFGPEFTLTPKDRFRSNADFYDFVSTLPALFPPGTRMEHCNGCYIALGAMIERVTQIPYEQYMAAHVFKPAGMTSTGNIQSDAIERNVAIGYTNFYGDGLRSNLFLHAASGSAAGGGYSTADDLLAFVNASHDGRLPMIPPAVRAVGDNKGVSTAVMSDSTWTVVVLANLDPPVAPITATTILDALARNQ